MKPAEINELEPRIYARFKVTEIKPVDDGIIIHGEMLPGITAEVGIRDRFRPILGHANGTFSIKVPFEWLLGHTPERSGYAPL